MEYSINNYRCELNANTNGDVVYSQVQRMYVKTRNQEERQRLLRITLERHSGISRVGQQTLTLQVTDDQDPFILYSLLLTEEDFKNLKAQQGLLVDFENFSSQLKRLFEQCTNNNTPNELSPKFLLILDETNRDSNLIYIKVLETNQFKHLCHLDLKLSLASDTDLKTHMSIQIKHCKNKNIQLEKQLSEQSIELTEMIKKFNELCQENDRILKKVSDEKNILAIQHLKELTQEKEQNSRLQIELQQKFDNIRNNNETVHKKKIAELEERLIKMHHDKDDMINKLSNYESIIQENHKKHELLEKDFLCAQKEIQSLKTQNAKLDIDYHEKEKALVTLKSKLVTFDQEIKAKVNLLNKQSELIKTTNEQKEKYEEELKKNAEYLQQKLQTVEKLSEELFKSNDLLHTTQTELNSINSKLKLRTCIALEQERLLDTKQQEIKNLMDDIALKKDTITEIIKKESDLKMALQIANEQLESQKEILKNNENVITWLNKRLKDEKSKVVPPINIKKGIGAQSTPYESSARSIQSYLMTKMETTAASGRNENAKFPESKLDMPAGITTIPNEHTNKGLNEKKLTTSANKTSSFFP